MQKAKLLDQFIRPSNMYVHIRIVYVRWEQFNIPDGTLIRRILNRDGIDS